MFCCIYLTKKHFQIIVMPVCYCKSLNKISRKTQPEENAIEHSKILVTLSLRVKWEETQSLHNINFPIERARKVLVSAFIPIQKYTSLYCLLSRRDGPGPVARNIPLLWALAWAACECLYFLCSRHRLLSQMWDQTNISKYDLYYMKLARERLNYEGLLFIWC